MSRYQLPEPGRRVRDRESIKDAPLIVVETHPDTAAADFVIDDDLGTVAELNPEYDGSAPVVEAVYLEDVRRERPDWKEVDHLKKEVAWFELSSYSFPAARLRWSE